MTLLEAIQHDLNNRPTRKSIRDGVPIAPSAEVTSVTLADLEAAFERVSLVMDKE